MGWWRNPESNRGHKDFQSSALPTELFRRPMVLNQEDLLIKGMPWGQSQRIKISLRFLNLGRTRGNRLGVG
jgi:hypothetical protein